MFIAASDMVNSMKLMLQLLVPAQCTRTSFCHLMLLLTWLYAGALHRILTIDCWNGTHAVLMQSFRDQVLLQ